MEKRMKYPRTPHLPWSPGKTKDDRTVAPSVLHRWRNVVVTEKVDGECTTLYRDGLHARSVDGRSYPHQDWIRNLHAQICHDIPPGFRICGENLYAKHSIAYYDLPSFFLVFNVWDGDLCLGWDETLDWCQLLGLEPVTMIYRGEFGRNILDEEFCRYRSSLGRGVEGYVVRETTRFFRSEFSQKVAKYVRKDHVQTDEHWLSRPIERNQLSRSGGIRETRQV